MNCIISEHCSGGASSFQRFVSVCVHTAEDLVSNTSTCKTRRVECTVLQDPIVLGTGYIQVARSFVLLHFARGVNFLV